MRFEASLVGVLALFILMANASFRMGSGGEPVIAPHEQETIEIEQIIQTVQTLPPPMPVLPLATVEEVADEEETTPLPTYDASLATLTELPLTPPPPPTPPPAPVRKAAAEPEPEIFVVVEQMPEIEGGLARLYELLEYPEMARRAGVGGRVVVEVVVGKDGRPVNPTIMRSANPLLDQAALDAVMQLTFTPGRQRGKAVAVRFSIPIRFELRENG